MALSSSSISNTLHQVFMFSYYSSCFSSTTKVRPSPGSFSAAAAQINNDKNEIKNNVTNNQEAAKNKNSGNSSFTTSCSIRNKRILASNEEFRLEEYM